DDGLPPRFAVQLFSTRQVDRIIERCAGNLLPADGPRVSGNHAAARYVDSRLRDGAVQDAAVIRKVGQQVHVGIEGENHGLVSLAQNTVQEAASGVLDRSQIILFASGSIQHQPQGYGQGHLLREKRNFLLVVVLEDLEVVLLQVRHDVLVLISDGGEQVDECHLRLDDRRLSLALRLSLRQRGQGQRQCRANRQTLRPCFLPQ